VLEITLVSGKMEVLAEEEFQRRMRNFLGAAADVPPSPTAP